MLKLFRASQDILKKYKSAKKLGLAPGSMVFTGERQVADVSIHITDYSDTFLQRQQVANVQDIPERQERDNRWIEIHGLHDIDFIKKLGNLYSIHPLILEDVLNVDQRAKVEDFDDYLFVAAKFVRFDEESKTLAQEQLSLILFPNTIISFQETDVPFLNVIHERMQNDKSRLRKFGIDYLLYAILDLLIDFYFLTIEQLENRFETLEDDVMSQPQSAQVEEIHKLKRQVIAFRKATRPLREVVNTLANEEQKLINSVIEPFLRDLYDHSIQVSDSLETLRDLVSGLMDTYLSTISNRMNEVMKVLTMIATIFIPLSFLAGLYGMNFEYMPELHYRWGYFVVLGVMGLVFVLMVVFFKRKRWL